MPICKCPVEYASVDYDYYYKEGTDYVGNISEYGFSGLKNIGGLFLAEIKNPSNVTEILENPGWEIQSSGFNRTVVSHLKANVLNILLVNGARASVRHISSSNNLTNDITLNVLSRR